MKSQVMDQQKALSLLSRQLIDIQSQADKILKGEDSPESIEGFARYSLELKNFINNKIENADLKKAACDISDINYQRTQIQLWQYILFPMWWISLYKDFHARKQTIEEVTQVRGKYASLYILLQSIIY